MALTYLLPFEIWQEIILNCEFLTAIRLRQLNKWFYKLEIHDFYNIDWKYLNKLSDDILKAYPFIQKLNASWNNMISDDGIKQLNLIKLYASSNSKIRDVNHITNLTELYTYNNLKITIKIEKPNT